MCTPILRLSDLHLISCTRLVTFDSFRRGEHQAEAVCPEFRRQAVSLAQSRTSVGHMAADLQSSKATLYLVYRPRFPGQLGYVNCSDRHQAADSSVLRLPVRQSHLPTDVSSRASTRAQLRYSIVTVADAAGPRGSYSLRSMLKYLGAQHVHDKFFGQRVLVTGGASFIGSHLVELLVEAGATVTVADDLSSGNLDNLAAVEGAYQMIRGDLRDSEVADRACRDQTMVFHLAAAHGGRGYIETHPVECLNNMVLDHIVFRSAASSGVARIVYASSACVYPTPLQDSVESTRLLVEDDANFTEPGKAFADGAYGWAKLVGELQLEAVHRQFQLDAVSCRLFTVYGPRENESHAVVALIAKALAKLDPYPIWGDGAQTRNFTFVKDAVVGMALAGATLSGFQAVNVGSDLFTSINELATMIFRYMGWTPEVIERQTNMPVGVLSRAASTEVLRRATGWAPTVSLSDGLAETIDWYRCQVSGSRLALLSEHLMAR